MRDILSKFDAIITETALNPSNPKGDYEAKKQALQDLEDDPIASRDPEISKAIDQRRVDLEKEAKTAGIFEIGDDFGISVSEDFEIGTSIIDILEDGIVVSLDETAINYLAQHGFTFEDGELVEGVAGPKSCWKGYRKVGTKPGTGKNAGKRVNDCEKIGEGSLEANTPDPVVVVQDLKGKVLDKVNLSVAVQKYKLGRPQDIKNQLAHQNYTTIGNYVIVSPMSGQPQDKTTKGVTDGLDMNLLKAAQGAMKSVKKDGESERNAHKPYGYRDDDSDPDESPRNDKFNKSRWHQHSILDKEVDEAEYQGRDVPLGKPMAGDVKKSKVYVKNPQGNVVKVNFGDKKMRIKKSNPARKRSFRARHNCDNPGPRHKARYWSCRAW